MNNGYLDLRNLDLDIIREALEERGQHERFLSDKDRDRIIDILVECHYGWILTEADLDSFYTTTFGFECEPDKELLRIAKEQVEYYMDDVDEDSPESEIFLANIVARYELEKAFDL